MHFNLVIMCSRGFQPEVRIHLIDLLQNLNISFALNLLARLCV